MKVLFLGNWAEISGWSFQQVSHILALDSVNVNIVPVNVNVLGNKNPDLPERIKELSKKDCTQPDVIIQNVRPGMLEKTGRAKCVSYFVCETSNFRSTSWAKHLNLMDLVLCPCFHNKQAGIDSGVDPKKIHVVPEAIDASRYAKDYETHQVRKNFPDRFIFLCVAEWTQRKNIDAIVRSFHTEFSPAEPVELVIKTTPVGMSNPQGEINARLEGIKRGLKLYNSADRYKRENVICGFSSEADIYSLHQSCDAFVCASRGEAFGIPVMDALGFGKSVVSPNHSGLDYLTDKNSFVVNSYRQPCFGTMDTLPELYGAGEDWYEVDLNSFREQMRACYEKRSLALKRSQAGRETVKQFSYEVVGRKYKEVLEKLI